MAASALDGLRVIEAGEGKALAYAGKLLRDLGAELIKVESPAGDALRREGPFPGDVPDPERSGLFVYLNGGKRGIRLDLTAATDRDRLDALLDGADVLLHSFRPSEAQRLRVSWPALRARWSDLVVTSLTAFGASGPYAAWRGYPLHSSAGSGVAFRIGEPDREPLVEPLDGADLHHGGPQAAAATLLALLHRDRGGDSQFVDLSVLEAATVAVWGHGVPELIYLGHPQGRRSGRYLNSGWPWGLWQTRDGDVSLITLQPRHWQAFLHELGDPEWGRSPLIANLGDCQHLRALTPEEGARVVDILERQLGPWFAERTNEEIWAIARRRRLPFLPLLTVPQVCESEQAEARGLLVDAPGDHPPLRLPRAPYLLSETPATGPGAPPRLDGPEAAEWSSTRRPAAGREGAPPGQPLEGLRVLDLGQVWAGPLLGRHLADFGADVVHVRTGERPPTSAGSTDPDEPLAWEWIYRNRRSLALDLQRPEGAALFRRLLAVADVLIDNFSPRVLPSLGLDHEQLIEANPRLIAIALSAAGRSGPWSELPGYGPPLAALYGLKSLNGYREDQRVLEDASELDPIAANYDAVALFAALHHRNRSGRGQLIELAAGEAGFAGLGEAVAEWAWNGRALGPQGNAHRSLAPHGVYPCSGDDHWIAIACGPDEEWRALAVVARREDWLARVELGTPAARRRARDLLDAEIGEWTRTRDKYELADELQAAGAPALPVLDALEVVGDSHHSARRRHFELHPRFSGGELLDGSPWHLSRTPPRLRLPAPDLGAHDVEVLAEWLGMPEDEVRRLEDGGVLA